MFSDFHWVLTLRINSSTRLRSTHSTSLSFSTSKLPFSSFSEKSEPGFKPEDIISKPGLEVIDCSEPPGLEERFDVDISPGSCKPGLEVRVDSETNTGFTKPGLEERTDSDIDSKPGLEERADSDFWKPGFEERVDSDFWKPDWEESTGSDINTGSCEPGFDLSWEPGLEFPMRIKMMMKLQKRNMNKELEAVLLTSSKTESIIFATKSRERERRRRKVVVCVRMRRLLRDL